MLESILNKDIELLIYLNNLGTIQWDSFWMFVTNKFSAIPLYVLLLFFTYKTLGLKKTIAVVLCIAILIAVSDQTSQLFKYGFKRLRPCHNAEIKGLIRLVKESCGGKYSYFSAHAANSMAIAIFFGKLLKSKFKLIAPLLLIWALLVGYSRIYIGVHFPLDVLTGFLFGILYASIFYYLVKLLFKKIKS
ncbi:phosphatase PAP2 family protein [Lutibacter sp. TH_r2]|uniref:phosphatase PAP2 family protein n=1 Tax=Lutibacter sp. TH_r2 TaxID=3082083 RepID=UPI0029551569|nr:phosphatase PAP2 family protein [Lutibacter sp. TH_r2]MDV7188169.1 phosphatase PAP2 family protein [Lutibacter sp. TH_r2]